MKTVVHVAARNLEEARAIAPIMGTTIAKAQTIASAMQTYGWNVYEVTCDTIVSILSVRMVTSEVA